MPTYSKTATREQVEIIEQFLAGITIPELTNRYMRTHIEKSEITSKDMAMSRKTAASVVFKALKLIEW